MEILKYLQDACDRLRRGRKVNDGIVANDSDAVGYAKFFNYDECSLNPTEKPFSVSVFLPFRPEE
jgi:hypothetical protein